MKPTTNQSQLVDDYIASFPPETGERLQEIRQLVKKLAPEAEEVISYRMPAFRYHGMLVYYAGFTHHVGMYPPVPEVFKDKVAKYLGPKGNLKFPHNEPLPTNLITEIIRFKIQEKEKTTSV